MATQNWPTSLPSLVNSESFSMDIGDTLIKTDMDIGPSKVRRRSTRSVDNYTITMDLNQSQVLALKTFFSTTLNGGATTFYFTDPLTNIVEIFRFKKPPAFSPIGSAGYFKVSMSWEKMP